MITGGKRGANAVNVWPGYVDALSALLMVVIFVLMIFTVVQFLLNEILSGQESQLATLQSMVADLRERLGLEQTRTQRLQQEIAGIEARIEGLRADKQTLAAQVTELESQAVRDRAEIASKLTLIASLQEDIDALRRMRAELEARVGSLAAALDSQKDLTGRLRDRSKALEARLAKSRERTVLAQKQIERRDIRIQALDALVNEQKEALTRQQTLTADARAEVVRLNRQLAALRGQLEEIDRALRAAETDKAKQQAKIEDLGRRLNIALARRVNALARYRSDFFGRLRTALADVPQVRIEGDRFVFQAELLFASGSAALAETGKAHLAKLAVTLREVAAQIPDDLNWILRIDGHTDVVPIRSSRFPSNWELSTARAVNVVHFLASQGIEEARMAAAGFSKFHPIAPGGSPDALRQNRRIEIKLTAR